MEFGLPKPFQNLSKMPSNSMSHKTCIFGTKNLIFRAPAALAWALASARRAHPVEGHRGRHGAAPPRTCCAGRHRTRPRPTATHSPSDSWPFRSSLPACAASTAPAAPREALRVHARVSLSRNAGAKAVAECALENLSRGTKANAAAYAEGGGGYDEPRPVMEQRAHEMLC